MTRWRQSGSYPAGVISIQPAVASRRPARSAACSLWILRGVMFNHAPAGYVCPFCRVATGGEDEHRTQRDVVRRDELATAFVSPRWWPRNHGHVMVVPNAHYENLY